MKNLNNYKRIFWIVLTIFFVLGLLSNVYLIYKNGWSFGRVFFGIVDFIMAIVSAISVIASVPLRTTAYHSLEDMEKGINGFEIEITEGKVKILDNEPNDRD